MSDRKTPRGERELAWHTHLEVATRTPFLGATPGRDRDGLVGEAVYDSFAVHTALHRLAAGITPDSPLVPVLLPALMATRQLLALRSSWTGYCNERFALDPAATDETSEMSRQYVAAEVARAWPKFDEGKAAYGEATAAVREFQPVLAQFCGLDSTSANTAAPGGWEPFGLRLVPGIRIAK
ncbi:hypothetical protein OG883_44075 [Streptomyces sp. NBC_01142]|uniref:hypothetical protein n=1 Tax=Streptomyces sp. NBC_01142 TaxID=2975865 RepID=UPI00224D82B6|nr:hypothetical protein [Streptomyces sp. NBC_01142]MCX4826621.1 hypothetical protein [Streptomyces sp. NBC_01142]